MTHPIATCLIVVSHPDGLHLRPSLAIANTVQKYQSRIEIRHGPQVADGRYVLELMLLAAAKGAELMVTATGGDADQALAAVADLLSQDFELQPANPTAGQPSRDLRESDSPALPPVSAPDDRLPSDASPDDPTPAEIHRECERIQSTWSEQEHRVRAFVRRPADLDMRASSVSCSRVFEDDGLTLRPTMAGPATAEYSDVCARFS
jgi:phosphotransferase system HPr (HPr) family protein